jgi:hypothetical protein
VADGAVLALDRRGAVRRWRPGGGWEPFRADVAALAEWPDGTVFALDRSGGLSRWVPWGGWWPHKTGVTALAADTDGGVYALSRDGMLDRADVLSTWFVVGGEVAELTGDGMGKVYARTAAGALVRYVRERAEPVGGGYARLLGGAGGAVYAVGTDGRLVRYAGSRWEPVGREAATAADGAAVAVDDGGLVRYDPVAVTVDRLRAGVAGFALADDGTVFARGPDGTLARWAAGGEWTADGAAVAVAAGADGTAFALRPGGRLERWAADGRWALDGMAAVLAASADGGVFVLRDGHLRQWEADRWADRGRCLELVRTADRAVLARPPLSPDNPTEGPVIRWSATGRTKVGDHLIRLVSDGGGRAYGQDIANYILQFSAKPTETVAGSATVVVAGEPGAVYASFRTGEVERRADDKWVKVGCRGVMAPDGGLLYLAGEPAGGERAVMRLAPGTAPAAAGRAADLELRAGVPHAWDAAGKWRRWNGATNRWDAPSP